MQIRSGIMSALALASTALTSGCFEDKTPYIIKGQASAAADKIVASWIAAGRKDENAPSIICGSNEYGPGVLTLDLTNPNEQHVQFRKDIETAVDNNPKACTVTSDGRPVLLQNITAPLFAPK